MSAAQQDYYLTEFEAAYIECALWSSTDQADDTGGQPLDENYDIGDLAPEARAAIHDECADFYSANADDLARLNASQCGHDFWLTRNRHGAGFWDRGYGELGARLTEAAHAYGSSDLYIGDDGRIYVS